MATITEKLNALSATIGAALFAKAIAEKDRATIIALRDETIRTLDILIKLSASNPSYQVWRDTMVELNRGSAIHQLDLTGEFSELTRIQELCDLSDAYAAFMATANPEHIKQLESGKAIVMAGYGDVLNMFVQENRSMMRAVK